MLTLSNFCYSNSKVCEKKLCTSNKMKLKLFKMDMLTIEILLEILKVIRSFGESTN